MPGMTPTLAASGDAQAMPGQRGVGRPEQQGQLVQEIPSLLDRTANTNLTPITPNTTTSVANRLALQASGYDSMATHPVLCSESPGTSPLNSSQGTLVISPAPSPDTSSAEQAPRCSMQPSATSACAPTHRRPAQLAVPCVLLEVQLTCTAYSRVFTIAAPCADAPGGT